MKRTLIVAAGLTVLVGSLIFAGIAFAQNGEPPVVPAPFGGYGRMMGGTPMARPGPGWMTGSRMTGAWQAGGPLHDYMHTAMSEALGLTRAELDARLVEGETMYAIALAEGVPADEFVQWMADIRAQALEQAVADGVIAAEQAGWMQSHMGGRGAAGRGQGWNGACPLHSATPDQ